MTPELASDPDDRLVRRRFIPGNISELLFDRGKYPRELPAA